MGKAIGLLVAGLLILLMGLRSMTSSGQEAEIEQTYRGETVSVTCRDGEPVAGEGLERQAAREKCAEEENGSGLAIIMLGVVLAGWGAFELRKARA